MTQTSATFQVGRTDKLVVINSFGSAQVAPNHMTFTPETARVIARDMLRFADEIDAIEAGLPFAARKEDQ
jgi:hypothetical protein